MARENCLTAFLLSRLSIISPFVTAKGAIRSAIVTIGLLFTGPVSAQEWKYLGLSTESITAIAVNWSNAQILYAGSSSDFSSGKVGAIFRSTDGGASWDTLIRGVTVRDLDIHPNSASVVFATLGINFLTPSGIIKTTNGGHDWVKADSGIYTDPEVGPGVLVIDPKHPDTLYAGTAGFQGGGFYKSTNGGTSWASFGDTTSLGRSGVTAIAVDPENTSVVYAGTPWIGALLRSIDGGRTWNLMGLFEGGIVYDIQVCPFDTRRVYCGVHPHGFYFSTDAGSTWTKANEGLPNPVLVEKVQLLCDPTDDRIFLVGNGPEGGGVYERTDAQKWRRLGIDGSRVNTITLSGSTLYAGSTGVYVTQIATQVADELRLPKLMNLFQSYPNPFNSSTTIAFEIPFTGMVSLTLFDVLGRQVIMLESATLYAGTHRVNWNGKNADGVDVSSGVYICRLQGKGIGRSIKIMLLR